MNWRYTDATNTTVISEDGRQSCLVTALPYGTAVDPYIPPVPSVAECLAKIDADTDSIYGAVLGNRGDEYTRAATDAQAYKDAGYTGTVPTGVQSWATAKSWTPTQATDDILVVATQWVGAQSAIRATRLLHKEQVRSAVDAQEVNTAMASWAGFVSYIRAQLGVA